MQGHVFAAYTPLGETQGATGTIRYIWASVQSFSEEQGVIKLVSGTSLPVAIHLSATGEALKVLRFEAPRDGNLYGPDIRRLFPKDVQTKIFNKQGLDTQELDQENRRQAETYFTSRQGK